MIKVVKYILLLFLVTVVYGRTSAQNFVDTIYWNEEEEVVTSENAYYFGIREYDKSGEGIGRYYLMSGELIFEREERKGKKDGWSKTYLSSGELLFKGAYRRGKPVGKHSFFDVNGNITRVDIYNWWHKKIGEYYFRNGQKVYTQCQRLSSFGNYRNENKALREMGRFIDTALVRPPIAADYELSSVLASFIITPGGEIEDIRIDVSVHPALDQAVIDVIKKMPKWKPAKFKGKTVYSEFYVAVNF